MIVFFLSVHSEYNLDNQLLKVIKNGWCEETIRLGFNLTPESYFYLRNTNGRIGRSANHTDVLTYK